MVIPVFTYMPFNLVGEHLASLITWFSLRTFLVLMLHLSPNHFWSFVLFNATFYTHFPPKLLWACSSEPSHKGWSQRSWSCWNMLHTDILTEPPRGLTPINWLNAIICHSNWTLPCVGSIGCHHFGHWLDNFCIIGHGQYRCIVDCL